MSRYAKERKAASLKISLFKLKIVNNLNLNEKTNRTTSSCRLVSGGSANEPETDRHNQLFHLEPYHKSHGKRLAKFPKLYFTDTGLAAFLLGYQSATALWYRRDQSGNEVDLLIESDNRLTAIECKLTERPGGHDLRGLARLTDFYGPEAIAHSYIACTAKQPFDPAPGITARSGWTTWKLPSAPDSQTNTQDFS